MEPNKAVLKHQRLIQIKRIFALISDLHTYFSFFCEYIMEKYAIYFGAHQIITVIIICIGA